MNPRRWLFGSEDATCREGFEKSGFTERYKSRWPFHHRSAVVIRVAGGDGLAGIIGQAFYRTLASEATLDMWAVKALHTTIRRSLHAHSVHTWLQGIVEANAEYVSVKAQSTGKPATPDSI